MDIVYVFEATRNFNKIEDDRRDAPRHVDLVD